MYACGSISANIFRVSRIFQKPPGSHVRLARPRML